MTLRLCLLLGFVLPGCVEPGIGADPRWGRSDAIRPKAEWMLLTPAFRILPLEISEASGLVFLGGNYFVHNDSGDRARVFRATRLDFADFEELPAPGAQAIDWEEITTYRGDLLVCDTGNNRGTRHDVMLYRFAYVDGDSKDGTPATRAPLQDSARGSGRLELRARYPVRYADGPHDVEAAFAIQDHLYLVTKDRGEGTWVLRFDELRDESALPAGAANVPVPVAMLDLDGEQVTAATYDERHEVVIVLAYSGISVYPARRLEGPPARTTRIWARQAEAICVQGDSLIFANEQRDVFVVEHFLENPRDEALPPPGEGTLPSVSTDFTDPALTNSTTSTSSARSAFPAVVSDVRIDGDSSEWSSEASSLSLRNSLPGESFRWLKVDDRLLVDARVCVVASPEQANPESLRTGSGVLLSFADADSRSTFLDGSQTQLFFEVGPVSSSEVWRLSFRGYDLSSMTRVNGSAIAASLEPPSTSASGWFAFEAMLPTAAIWSDRSIPETFLFDIQGIGLREGEEVHFSAADLYSIYRPYAWGNITLVR